MVPEILTRCGVDAEQTDRICKLIADHGNGKAEDTAESRILRDAEWLARIGDRSADSDALKAKGSFLSLFRTPKGRELASLLMSPGDARSGQAE